MPNRKSEKTTARQATAPGLQGVKKPPIYRMARFVHNLGAVMQEQSNLTTKSEMSLRQQVQQGLSSDTNNEMAAPTSMMNTMIAVGAAAHHGGIRRGRWRNTQVTSPQFSATVRQATGDSRNQFFHVPGAPHAYRQLARHLEQIETQGVSISTAMIQQLNGSPTSGLSNQDAANISMTGALLFGAEGGRAPMNVAVHAMAVALAEPNAEGERAFTWPEVLQVAPATAQGHQALVATVEQALVIPESPQAEQSFQAMAASRNEGQLIGNVSEVASRFFEHVGVVPTEDLLRSEAFVNVAAVALMQYLNGDTPASGLQLAPPPPTGDSDADD